MALGYCNGLNCSSLPAIEIATADNPRVYSVVRANGKQPTQEEIQQQLSDLEHVKELREDIKRNGGLIEPLIVRGGSLDVLEGNSRLAAYRKLAE